LRLKLILSFLLIILVAVAGLALIVQTGTAREVRAFMFGSRMADVQGLKAELEDFYATTGSWQSIDTLLTTSGHMDGMRRGPGGMMNQRLQVTDAQGTIVADSSAAAIGATMNYSERSAAIPLQVNGQTVGYLAAQGGMGFAPGDEAFLLKRLNRAAMVAGLAAGGLALVLALVLSNQLLRPVRDLTHAARRLATGDLAQRVFPHGNDELAELGRTFNIMASSLQQAEEARQAMTADIAHELRTPLSVQRANLEALQDGVYPLTLEFITPLLEQNYFLTHLVEDLRTLALTDAGQLVLERTPTDLAGLLKRVVDQFQSQANAQGVKLELAKIPPGLPLLNLDQIRMEQIVNNLLSNALRYTSQEGMIWLTVEKKGPVVQVQVRDSGVGIPVDVLPNIFDRFYRADKARSRAEGGSGLGLAIARQLARSHDGELSAENHPQSGAVFTLSLPI
jgi:two-component system sensor histidine kinase BaeS